MCIVSRSCPEILCPVLYRQNGSIFLHVSFSLSLYLYLSGASYVVIKTQNRNAPAVAAHPKWRQDHFCCGLVSQGIKVGFVKKPASVANTQVTRPNQSVRQFLEWRLSFWEAPTNESRSHRKERQDTTIDCSPTVGNWCVCGGSQT